ncbi:hypothetical protein VZT92_005684 [Zoarces viviparus]|uniref:Uncharacterized protein n=1 Tax=Zoarces viviparus TaxID=48416 RepID=A0AAW1FTU6_ZOAVI
MDMGHREAQDAAVQMSATVVLLRRAIDELVRPAPCGVSAPTALESCVMVSDKQCFDREPSLIKEQLLCLPCVYCPNNQLCRISAREMIVNRKASQNHKQG